MKIYELNDISVRDLAKKIGVSYQYLYMVFKGEKTISEERKDQIIKLVPKLKNNFKVKEHKKITYLYKED